MPTKGAVLKKLNAVSWKGALEVLPRSVYPPQAIPASVIIRNPENEGVVTLGATINPAIKYIAN